MSSRLCNCINSTNHPQQHLSASTSSPRPQRIISLIILFFFSMIRTFLSSIFILGLSCLFHHAPALRDSCKVGYRTKLVRPCLALIKPCCGRASHCSFNHTMTGSWVTQVDFAPTESTCKRACNRHMDMCREKCQRAAQINAVRGSKICKCVRTFPVAVVIEQCLNSCSEAEMACNKRCRNGKQCPLKAVTKVVFNRNYAGSCTPFCLRPTLTVGPVPVCPPRPIPI